MDVNALRQLVDDVALKKSEIDQIEIGINRNFLFGTSPYARLEMPSGYVGMSRVNQLIIFIIL